MFSGLALMQLIGPMKLLAADVMYVLIATVGVWFVSKVRCKDLCSSTRLGSRGSGVAGVECRV